MTTNVGTPVKAGNIRLWVTEEGVHPLRTPEYQAMAVPGDPTWSFGEDTPIQVPDPNRSDSWVQAGSVKGAKERPTTSMMGRYPMDESAFLRLSRKQCRLDIYELIGACENPQDFTDGWEKIRYWPDGRISSYSNEGVGALQSDDNAPTNETVELSAREFYEIGQMKFEQVGSAETVREIITVDVCDDESCGDCGRSSDGCQRVIAVMIGTGATPGTLPSVVFSEDSGNTFSTDDIDTMFSNELPTDAACIGGKYFVVASVSNSLHFVDVQDLYDGVPSWTEVNTGFLAGGPPIAIWSNDARHTWIVGENGFIYFSATPQSSVTVQDQGIATTQNLQDVHAYDSDNVLAVGDLNAVVTTMNGGGTWQSVTGPSVGVTLRCCWMWSADVWFVGDVLGSLFLTVNGGISWTTVSMPITVTSIDEIEFVDEAVGYIAVRQGTAGLVLRTMTGGNDWKVLPDGRSGNIPANDQLNSIAVCEPGSSVMFAAGLDDDGTAGIIVKAEA